MKKCVANRITTYLERASILSDSQYGFKKGVSTVDAFLDYSEFLYQCLDEKKHVVSVFADFSKAFDTVNHNILLTKLKCYGISVTALNWFKSYLHNRKQCVRIGSVNSQYLNITGGVPQGSVLGPILFLLYINDLPRVTPLLKTILFADDTTLSASHSDFHNLVTTLNLELSNFSTWTKANRLSLNTDKTSSMLFSNRISLENADSVVSLNNTNISFLHSSKFLGVTVDSRLRFNEQISSLCCKLSKTVGIFYKLSFYLPKSSLIRLYYSLFYPYVIYCNLIWGGAYNVHLNILEMLQKKIIRIVTRSEFLAHTDPLFYETKILKIADVHKFLLAIYVYKKFSKFTFPNHAYETRISVDPSLNYHRLTLSRQSLSYAGPNIWNNIPLHIKTSPSLPIFRKRLKFYFLSQYARQ